VIADAAEEAVAAGYEPYPHRAPTALERGRPADVAAAALDPEVVGEVALIAEGDPDLAALLDGDRIRIEGVLSGAHPHRVSGGNGDGSAVSVVPPTASGEGQAGGEDDPRTAHGRRIVCRRVTRPTRLVPPVALGLALLAAGCGQGEISVSGDQPTMRSGAKLFNERCSGCHSLDSANAYGSKPTRQLQGGERTNGPNFNQRKVKKDDVLFAIRNGGFSGAIMPANVVVGGNADKVADFLDACSGKKNQRDPSCGQ